MDESFDIEEPVHVRQWFVLHVKPRTEKKTVLFLKKYRCFHHLPVYLKITKVQRRKVKHEMPLFPGYVFARLSPEDRVDMLKTNLVLQTILIPHPRQTIHELRQIRRAGLGSAEMRPVYQVFKEGDHVRVKYGPLRGTVGYVKRKGANATLCLNVEILGASVEISISPADLEEA